jgi:hypothetical protein
MVSLLFEEAFVDSLVSLRDDFVLEILFSDVWRVRLGIVLVVGSWFLDVDVRCLYRGYSLLLFLMRSFEKFVVYLD